MKTTKGFRITDEAFSLLQKLADVSGISKAAQLELLIRQEARRFWPSMFSDTKDRVEDAGLHEN